MADEKIHSKVARPRGKKMMLFLIPVLMLTLLSPTEACFPVLPVCPNDKQSCITDNNDNVLQIKEVSNPLKCSKWQQALAIKRFKYILSILVLYFRHVV